MSIMTVSGNSAKWRRWVREPLVQFLAIGLLLFVVFAWFGDSGPNSNHIVVTQGQIDALAARFVGIWRRPPNEQEMKSMVDDFVREEMATREAMRIGLDRDDVIIRRRLRQKLEFLVEDTSNASPPTDAELQAYLDQHPDKFRAEPQVAFRQVFLNPTRHHDAIAHDAKVLLARLSASDAAAEIKTLGDPLMLPSEMPLSSRSDVSRLFGNGFADEVLKLESGRWSGPIESAYGLHLVFASERTEGRLPSLAQIRPLVEEDVLSERRDREIDAMYNHLLERYHVTVKTQANAAVAQASSVPAGKTITGQKDVD
jgi:hypothetical protein